MAVRLDVRQPADLFTRMACRLPKAATSPISLAGEKISAPGLSGITGLSHTSTLLHIVHVRVMFPSGHNPTITCAAHEMIYIILLIHSPDNYTLPSLL